MKDNGHVASHILDFRSLTTRLPKWSKAPLMYMFQKGLPSRLLDQLAVHQEPIKTLEDLMSAALDYDVQYHERAKDKNPGHYKSTGNKPKLQNPNPISTSAHPSKKKKFKGKRFEKKEGGSAKPAGTFKHVNEDGTVKAGEKQRREKLNLCAYCGGSHSRVNCFKLKAKDAAQAYAGPSKLGKA